MASILETFYLLFETNSKEVKKGTEEAQSATTAFEQGVQHMDAVVVASGEQILELFGRVAVRIASAFAIEEVAAFVGEVSELNAQLGVTAERLGLDVSDLDAYQQATERAGGSTDGFTQTLDFLNRGIADIATKGTSRLKPFFDELKIKVTDAPHHVRPLLDILGDLADKLSQMDAQQRAGIAEKLGIDSGTVLLLAQGRRGMEDLVAQQKALGVASKEDAEQAHAYRQSLENLEQQLRHVGTEIASGILPKLMDFFNWIGKTISYLGEHRGLVEGFFVGVAGVIGAVYFPVVLEAAAATWALLAPILAIVIPIAAVGAAVALVTDDVQNFLAGNKSVIGELSKTWPEVGATVRAAVTGMGEAFNWFIGLLEGGASLVGSILGFIGSLFASVFGGISYFVTQFAANFGKVFPVWAAGFNLVASAIEGMVGWIIKAVEWLAKLGFGAVKALPGALKNWAGQVNQETAVVQGKKTQAQVDKENRAALEARLSGHPQAPAPAAPATVDAPTPKPRPVAILKPAGNAAMPVDAWKGQLPKAVAEGVAKAQVAIHTADTSPLTAAPGAGRQAVGDRYYSLKVENLTVQTQATDADGISREITGHLDRHFRQAVDQFDDGVKG